MLAVIEATRAGYDEAILLTDDGRVADGSGENIFVVKDEIIITPDLSVSILPGHHARDRHGDRADPRLRRPGARADPLRPVRRRRGVHVRHGRRGHAGPVGRRPRDRRSGPGDEGDPGRVLRRRPRSRRAVSRGGSSTPRRRRRHRALDAARSRLSAPWIDGREEELVLETLRSGQLSLGPMIDRFEEALAERVGAPYVAAVSSGTAGLHLCMRLAGIGPGDEVVTTPFSFVASANCALYEGATPVFADIDPRHAEPRPGRGRGGDHAAHEGDPAGAHLRLPGRARRAGGDRRAARPRDRRGRRARRSAPSIAAGRSAPPAIRRSSRSTRTSR